MKKNILITGIVLVLGGGLVVYSTMGGSSDDKPAETETHNVASSDAPQEPVVVEQVDNSENTPEPSTEAPRLSDEEIEHLYDKYGFYAEDYGWVLMGMFRGRSPDLMSDSNLEDTLAYLSTARDKLYDKYHPTTRFRTASKNSILQHFLIGSEANVPQTRAELESWVNSI